jgi:hypothetical protein
MDRRGERAAGSMSEDGDSEGEARSFAKAKGAREPEAGAARRHMLARGPAAGGDSGPGPALWSERAAETCYPGGLGAAV